MRRADDRARHDATAATADEGSRGRRVVGRLEGRTSYQGASDRRPDQRSDAGGFERLIVRQIGKHEGSRAASIVFPAPGGPTIDR